MAPFQRFLFRCEVNLGLNKSGFSMKLFCGSGTETESNAIKVSKHKQIDLNW